MSWFVHGGHGLGMREAMRGPRTRKGKRFDEANKANM